MNNNLILGDGLLGKELRKQTGWAYISRKKDGINFCDLYSYAHLLYDFDVIINTIACTKTYSTDKQCHWDTNFVAVCDLVDFLNKKEKKIVQISTDYVYSGSNYDATEEDVPVHCKTFYGYTKLLGESYVQARARDYLIIRTSFKPYPFPYQKAITCQTGNFDFVDTISSFIIDLIERGASGVYNVGTDKKTILDLARTTGSPIPSSEMIHPEMPLDISMNIKKMRKFLYD